MASNTNHNTGAELADEIEVINAIYGESTMKVTSTRTSDVVCLLNLRDQTFSVELCFPASYPAQSPLVTGIDPLWKSQWDRAKRLKATLESVLEDVFVSGQVCMFDALEVIRAKSESTSSTVSDTVVSAAERSTSFSEPPVRANALNIKQPGRISTVRSMPVPIYVR